MAEIIALSGFMGCGKSTVARLLAEQGSGFFFDLDDTIELEEGRSVSEIFASDGEQAFRKLEYKYLERIISDFEDFDQKIIISLGGGTLTSPECAELLARHARVIYLRASAEQIVYNLKIVGIENRPLLCNALKEDGSIDEVQLLQKVRQLLATRAPIYEKTADIILDIDGLSPEQIAENYCL